MRQASWIHIIRSLIKKITSCLCAAPWCHLLVKKWTHSSFTFTPQNVATFYLFNADFSVAEWRSLWLLCAWWKKTHTHTLQSHSVSPYCGNVYLVTLSIREGSPEVKGLETHPSLTHAHPHTHTQQTDPDSLLTSDLATPHLSHFLCPTLSSTLLSSCLCCFAVSSFALVDNDSSHLSGRAVQQRALMHFV